jgi:seryl-tRNA synthetase
MKLIKRNNVTSLHPSMEAREHQYLKHLASAMSHYLENPYGTELICVLGSGFEKDNRQALDTWVAFHRDEIFEKRLEGQSPLDFLISKLESLIND